MTYIWTLFFVTNFWMLLTFMLHSELNALEEKNTPWINSGLKIGMRHRDAAKREAMESNDPRDWPKDKL